MLEPIWKKHGAPLCLQEHFVCQWSSSESSADTGLLLRYDALKVDGWLLILSSEPEKIDFKFWYFFYHLKSSVWTLFFTAELSWVLSTVLDTVRTLSASVIHLTPPGLSPFSRVIVGASSGGYRYVWLFALGIPLYLHADPCADLGVVKKFWLWCYVDVVRLQFSLIHLLDVSSDCNFNF